MPEKVVGCPEAAGAIAIQALANPADPDMARAADEARARTRKNQGRSSGDLMPKQRYVRVPGSPVYHVRTYGLRFWEPTAACGQKMKHAEPYLFENTLGRKPRLCRKCRGMK